MLEKPLVFISSTSDMKEDCDALVEDLRPTFEPYSYHKDPARRVVPQQRCREVIAESDVFVGLLGPTYGTTMRDGRSIVQWEHDTACYYSIEILVFIKNQVKGTMVQPPQKEFINRLTAFEDKNGLWCNFYDSQSQLLEMVRRSLDQWLVDRLRRLRRAVLTLAVIAAALIFAFLVLVMFASIHFSRSSILAASFCVFLLPALYLVFLTRHGPWRLI